MQFTVSSLLNVTILSGISVFFLWFILRHQYFINRLSFSISFLCLGLLCIRIFVPGEYYFITWSIYDKKILPIIQEFFQHNLFTLNNHPFHVSHFLLIIWIIGSIIIFFYQLFKYLNFYRFARNLPVIQDVYIEDILTKITNIGKKKKRFHIVHTEHVHSPMIIRFRSYYIILPKISLSEEELACIIEHEAVHAYHGDLWIKAFVNILCILYWWNPFMYLFEIEMDKLLEFRADYFVTHKMSALDRTAYSECLIHIAKEQRKFHPVPITLSFLGRKKFALTQRVHFILEQKSKKISFLSCIIFLPFLLTITFSFCVIFEPTHDMPPEDAAKGGFSLTPETAYFIHISDDCYHLYLDGKYMGTTPTTDIGVDLPIYESEENLP